MNTFGLYLRLTTFGESHGPAVGGVLDGLPPGLHIDMEAVLRQTARRRPGSNALATARDEADTPEWLSGIGPDGRTLGTPIAFMTRNADCRPADYERTARLWRPDHADYTTDAKYGIRDHRGGGRASARETWARVVAGALAAQWLATLGIEVRASLSGAGNCAVENPFDTLENHPGLPPCLDISAEDTRLMHDAIAAAKSSGDSIGGAVACLVTGLPPGTGEPVYAKLHARLAEAMMGINAAKAFEYGSGIRAAGTFGSETKDTFAYGPEGKVTTLTNHSGGVQGGISNGMPVYFRVYFKPTPTIMRPVSTAGPGGLEATLPPAGRHDPCVALRAVPVVEAMAALTVADLLLAPFSPLHGHRCL